MFGVYFSGHSDSRRILTDYGFSFQRPDAKKHPNSKIENIDDNKKNSGMIKK